MTGEAGTTIGYSNTSVSLRVLVGVVVCTLAIGAAYWDLKSSITAVAHRIDLRMSDRWRATDDRLFMLNFANVNSLAMPTHGRAIDERNPTRP